MEAVERSHPWSSHVKLSVEDMQPLGRQSPQRSRSRLSPNRRRGKHRANSFDEVLVDELDMLRDAAATIIQAAWRGYQAREQLRAEYEAAVAIQALWRGYLARQRTATQRAEAAAWEGYGAEPGHRWAEPDYRRAKPGYRRAKPGYHRAEPGYIRAKPRYRRAERGYRRAEPGYPWVKPELDKEQAVVVIQAHYRGYRVRCEIYNQHLAAAIIQAHYRGYRARQDLAAMHQAATTIQAHWRSYCARQAVAQARAVPRSSSSLRDFLSQTYHGLLDYMTGAQPSPTRTSLPPKRHPVTPAHSQLSFPVRRPGQPRAGGEKLPKPTSLEQRGDPVPAACKKCPQCGRSTMVRVLVGVGRGMDDQPDASSERYYPLVPGLSQQVAPSHRTEGAGYSAGATHPYASAGHGHAQARQAGLYHMERAEGTAQQGHRHWTGTLPANKMAAEARAAPSVWHQGREAGLRERPFVAQAATRCGEWGRGTVAARSAMLYPCAASCPPSAAGGAEPAWLSRHVWAGQPHGEGRVFKTRKQHWQLARAATLIQAFWRGCQARQALREQQDAAVRIQSAFRGYRTRTYLSATGILSGGETEEEADSGWSCRPGRCR